MIDLDALKNKMNVASLHVDAMLGRFYAEIEFARGLCELHKDEAARWRKLIAKACDRVTAVTLDQQGSLAEAVREAEEIMAPIGVAAKQYTVHCVGHAHIDMNWKWDWPETVAVTNDTFTTMLRLMEEYPDFRFSQSQASVYALTKKYNPKMLDKIRERIHEGRWEVTASHWVEADKNLAATESYCRHILYTRRFMEENFGLKPEDVPIDWEPDTFGHSLGVPTYLSRGAVKYLYACRPGAFGPKRPFLFRWKGIDGSTVLVCNDRWGYNGDMNPNVARNLVAYAKETGLKDFIHVFGAGDHGGGPTVGYILIAREMSTWPIFPNFKFSTAKAYFERVEQTAASLPTLDFELQFLSPGTYTSQTLIKRLNRTAESRLCDAEAACAILWSLFGDEYPGTQLREGWQDTLFQHFHDIVTGTNIHDSHEYVNGKLQDVAATTGMAETLALRALAGRVDTSGHKEEIEPGTPKPYMLNGMGAGVGFESGGGRISQAEESSGGWPRNYMIFNPTGHERSDVVISTAWEADPWVVHRPLEQWGEGIPTKQLADMDFSVRTPSGKVIPAQKIETGAYWVHRYVRLAFPIEAVGAFGYGVHTLLTRPSDAELPGAVKLTRLCTEPANYDPLGSGWILENDLTRAHVGSHTGAVHSLLDKKSGMDVVDPADPIGALEFGIERPHGGTAWVHADWGRFQRPVIERTRTSASGPYIARVSVDWHINESKFTTTYEMRHGDPNLYISLEGLWLERGSEEKGVPSLKMTFPLNLKNPVPRYEIPFGSLERTRHNGLEVPAFRWAQVTGDLGDGKAGLLLMNDCKNGHSLTGNVLRLSLIRSTCDPDLIPEIGEHKIGLALRPYSGEMPAADATRAAQAFNHPLRVVGTDIHKGNLPKSMAPFSVGPKNVVVSAFKKAESDNALVVRLIETAGRRATARVKFDEACFGTVRSAVEADLMERPMKESSAKIMAGNVVKVTIPARGFATVLVKTKAGRKAKSRKK